MLNKTKYYSNDHTQSALQSEMRPVTSLMETWSSWFVVTQWGSLLAKCRIKTNTRTLRESAREKIKLCIPQMSTKIMVSEKTISQSINYSDLVAQFPLDYSLLEYMIYPRKNTHLIITWWIKLQVVTCKKIMRKNKRTHSQNLTCLGGALLP